MSSVQAETLLYYLQNQNQVSFAKVYDSDVISQEPEVYHLLPKNLPL